MAYGFFTPQLCDLSCLCGDCQCLIVLRMVERPGTSCSVDFTTDLVRRCGGTDTILDPDLYNIWIRFESDNAGEDPFTHYEGPMSDFLGIFENFRPVAPRTYTLTAYQAEGEFSGDQCPDPIETVVVTYTEERSCDVCEDEPMQDECECDGGSPVPTATFTIAGSAGILQIAVNDFPVYFLCDPYPGFGASDGVKTLWSPSVSCSSIAGTYLVPCTEGGWPVAYYIANALVCPGETDASRSPFNQGANVYYFTALYFYNDSIGCRVEIDAFTIKTDTTLTVGELVEFDASAGLPSWAIVSGLEPASLSNGHLQEWFADFRNCVNGEIKLCTLLGSATQTLEETGLFNSCNFEDMTITVSR